MSKSNADFSAFDFNDSSDNSLESHGPFLSRSGVNASAGPKSTHLTNDDNNCSNLNGEDEEDDDDEPEDGGDMEQGSTEIAASTTTLPHNNNNINNNYSDSNIHPSNLAASGLHMAHEANGSMENIAEATAEGLLMDGNAGAVTGGCDDSDGSGVGGGCDVGIAGGPGDANSNCGVSALLDGALGSNNNMNNMHNNNNIPNNNTNSINNNSHCNELMRSSSASLSNNSTSTTLGMGIGANGIPSGGSVAGGGGNGGGGNGGGVVSGAGSTGGLDSGGGIGSVGSVGGGSTSTSDRKKYRHQNYSKNIYIGTKNAEKWEHTRTRLQFKNDVEFVAYLLNFADNDTERLANLPPLSAPTTPTKGFAGNFKLEPNLSVKEFSNSQTEVNGEAPPPPPVRKRSKKRVQFSDALNGLSKIKDFSNFAVKAKKHDQKMKQATNNSDLLPEVLDCRIAEKIKSEMEEKTASRESLPNALCLKKNDEFPMLTQRSDGEEDDALNQPVSGTVVDSVDGINGQTKKVRKNKKKLKGVMVPPPPLNNSFHGFGTAGDEEDDDDVEESDGAGDDDDEEMDEEALAREMKNEQNFVEEEDEHDIAFRSNQSCRECSITHDWKACPLHNAIGTITDAVDLAEWIERKNLEALAKLKSDAQRQAKQDHDDDDEDMDETSQMSELETKPLITFAEASVPAEFELHNVEPNVIGVFARTEVRAFTKLGPLIGQRIESNDMREGSNMRWIFEICEAGADKSQLLDCENPNTSNWLRYIRPAPTYDERNVNLVSVERQAFFVTCRDVKNGMELLYWSDDCNTMWRKKHTEKTNCGGCNLKFEHPLYYRTHCSVFHDPSMSLTIRKYHCKVCGDAVLGKDNIMKHAAEMHDGKGAYQCQFCNKFFLRLNYLEMHRIYGCAANPNRARPLCDFCGRKFCQPQKLKAHIKRVHSDMADVLRDFQCKLCSKLLGSRAALQRHSKEVHSRNSTVVSCPRCQKLFQNRSNLKIHMLTHSGVRPFKCAEPECNAAFTTKQCLQFHYKKVHNYSQEQMPKIERSVAYTFDAYSGGMKVDFLEQAPRRRRKSLEDQNSLLSSSMLDSKSDTEFSDDNIFEAIKKSGKSIKDLCRNEPNLSLLSSKISSIFGEKVIGSRKRKKRNFRANDPKEQPPTMMGDEDDEDERMEHVRRKQNAQLSLVESFLSTTAHRLTAQQQVQQVVAAAAAVSAMAGGGGVAGDVDPNKMQMMPPVLNSHHPHQMSLSHGPGGLDNEDDEEDDEDEDDEHDMHQPVQQHQSDNSGYRHHAGMDSPMAKDGANGSGVGMNVLGQNLVVSKGSKKWISGDDRHLQRDCASVDRCAMGNGNEITGGNLGNAQPSCNIPGPGGSVDMGMPGFAVPPGAVDDPSKLIGQNRDFLARLMNSANANHGHHNSANHEEDENSSFLDVVESNNANAAAHMAQYHHNGGGGQATSVGTPSSGSGGGTIGVPSSVGNQNEGSQLQMNSLAHSQSFMSNFYNQANSRLASSGSGVSSSASMLVEAALNSVGNMIDNESNDLKVPIENNINNDSPMSSHVEADTNRYSSNPANNSINSMDNLENELKMMKNLGNFPMQINPLPMFPNTGNNMNACNISPDGSTPANPQSNQNNNDVEVDSSSTPRSQHINTGADSDGFSSGHHRTPPSPQPISPGRDYGMFGSNSTPAGAGGANGPGTAGSASSGNSGNNNISASSPLPTMPAQRQNASSVGSSYPEHELISPASSPSIPRYNFNGEMMRHKRSEQEQERRQNLSAHNQQLSSDEENSIIPHNSSGQDMRMKFTQSQMDLMYSKYDSMAGTNSHKYNNQELEPSEFRGSNNSAANDISDLQGLDMSSRSSIGASNYHHNFQLPSSASSNIGGIGRYHHHIYDILSEREQNQQQQQAQQQQQHHSAAPTPQQHQQEHSSQLQAMQQHQSAMQNMLPDQLNDQEHDQTTSVDLSRTANYVVPSPPQLPYNHPHHDMLRMASLDLTPNTNMSVGNNRSFLTSQMQHQSRESLEHHRLLSTVEQHRILAASNAVAADQHRLLVDPTAHLLMEQNNRLLGSDQSRLLGETAQNRHMARGFGAYHQVASGNYHPGVRPPVLPSPNHHASNPSNYHPFPAYY